MDDSGEMQPIDTSKSMLGWFRLLFVGLISFTLLTGCFVRVPIKNTNIYPKVFPFQRNSLLPVSIAYFDAADRPKSEFSEFTRYVYRDKIRDLLTQDGYDFIFYDKTVTTKFSHRIAVTITETERTIDAGGLDILCGLSLGVIPSYHPDAKFRVEVALLEGNQVLEILQFNATIGTYAGWVFFPLYPFLNQDDTEVIAEEIHKSINLLLYKQRVAIVASQQSLPFQHFTSETSGFEKKYLEQINSESIETIISAAKHMVRTGKLNGPTLYETIDQKILTHYKKIKEPHTVDEIAWLCKALASSGEDKYKETLYRVAKDGDSYNLRRHARDSMNAVDVFAKGEVGFKGPWRKL